MKRVTGVLALAVLAFAGVSAGIFLPAGGAAPRAADGSATKVTVKASEFKYALSKKAAPRGVVVFTIVNNGKLPHDFKIAGKKSVLIKPGKSATLRVTIAKKGSFSFLCTVPGHARAGMKGVFAAR